jgi:hypothetical protein
MGSDTEGEEREDRATDERSKTGMGRRGARGKKAEKGWGAK